MQIAARLLAYGLFLFSGATALVYQVTWLRDLSLIFGGSFYATSIVLASFMGGLALGGFVAGRFSDGLHRPLSAYGILEIAIALFAMVLPGLLRGVDDFYVSAAHAAGGVTPALNAMRFVLAFGVLVLPTFFMGATLPVLIRFMVHAYGELGTRLSLLYGINTLGAAAGAMTAGFVLLPRLGTSATQVVAVQSNLVIGALAIAIDLAARRKEVESAERTVESESVSESPDLGTLPLRLAFMGTAVAGFAALNLEVLWTRAISLIIGSTTYSFTIMLAAFLVGISLGSWIHATVPLRRINESVQFGTVLLIIGVTSFLSAQLIPRVPDLALRLNLLLAPDHHQISLETSLVVAFAVMLIPSIFMGIAFPVASQARARLVRKFGESVGDTVGLNTLGSILGSLSAGFVLIPVLGLQRGMVFASCVAIGYALIVLAAALTAGSSRRHVALSAFAALAILLVVGAPLVAPRWDVERLATFKHDRIPYYTGAKGNPTLSEDVWKRLLYYKEGQSSTVAVVDAAPKGSIRGRRYIAVNGKIVASDGPADMAIELLLGHVPALLHPDPRTALVIGYGAGVTLGAVSSHGGIEELTLVEIEPAVLGSGSLFRHVNDDVLNDPRLEIIIQDGRNFVKTTNRKFDVITADPVHPWAAGSAYLYTTDYYRLASQRLNDGGVMCQWVPLTALSVENIKSIIASFAENFENVSVWNSFTDIALIGSNSPISLSMERVAERLAEPDVHRQLGWVNFDGPGKFMSRLALETRGVEMFAQDGVINTDDNLYLEFSAPLAIGTQCTLRNLCGMSAGYPIRIAMVESWSPLFDTAYEASNALQQYRREHSRKLMKVPVADSHRSHTGES
jgi:spermidine synthase